MAKVPEEWRRGAVLGRKDIAEIFDVTPETVGRWAIAGKIGFFRTPGGNRRFPECEVERMQNGEPVPDIVKELAADDRERYVEKWGNGWRQNEMTKTLHEEAKQRREGRA